MTRFPRTTPFALTTVILASVAGLGAAATLGVRDADSAEWLSPRPAEVVEGARQTSPPVGEAQPPAEETLNEALNQAAMNSIRDAPAPGTPDSWARGPQQFEHFRTWAGEMTVWRGGRPQIILGPEGNWFPAGQPGCGEGAYVITFRSAGGEELGAQLIDVPGGSARTGDQVGRAAGWILSDDCHLPYLSLADLPGSAASAQVSYTVHEYHRVSR